MESTDPIYIVNATETWIAITIRLKRCMIRCNTFCACDKDKQ